MERYKPDQTRKSPKKSALSPEGTINTFSMFIERVKDFPVMTRGQEVASFLAYEEEKKAENLAKETLLEKLSPKQKQLVNLRLERKNNGEKVYSDEDVAIKLMMPAEKAKELEADTIAALTEDKKQTSVESIITSAQEKARKETHALQMLKDDPEFPETFAIAFKKSDSVQDFIANCNLKLVIHIAKKWKSENLTMEDKIQEGYTGLKIAIERFDYQKGFKLSVLATQWIKQSITRAIEDTDRVIRLPNYIEEAIVKGKKEQNKFIDQYGTEPSVEELAPKMIDTNVREEKAREIADMLLSEKLKLLSLHQPIRYPEDAELGNVIPDSEADTEHQALNFVESTQIVEALSKLPEREKDIFITRNLHDKPFSEIAKRHKLGTKRTRELHAKAREALQNDPVLQGMFFDRITQDISQKAS